MFYLSQCYSRFISCLLFIYYYILHVLICLTVTITLFPDYYPICRTLILLLYVLYVYLFSDHYYLIDLTIAFSLCFHISCNNLSSHLPTHFSVHVFIITTVFVYFIVTISLCFLSLCMYMPYFLT